jgi:Flp pilus assembly protein TadD
MNSPSEGTEQPPLLEGMPHYKEGLKLFGENKHTEAIDELQQALKLSPDWTDALHALAMVQMQAGHLEEAVATGQRIVELDPEDPFAHTSLSMFYQRMNRIDDAEAEAAKARMISWKQELKDNPDAPPPGPPGSMNVKQ